MARGRKIRPRKQPKTKKTKTPRRRFRKRRTTKQPGLGKLVAKGAKSLISSIPFVGETLKNVADIAFKYYGLSAGGASLPNKDSILVTDTKNVSLVSRFWYQPIAIISDSKGCIQMDMGKTVMTQYAEGRVIMVTIEVIPIGNLNERAGDWHLGIQPFFNEKYTSNPGLTGSWLPTETGIHHMYKSVTGPANKKLSITYRPKVVDGKAFTFMPLNDDHGEVAIRYDHYARNSYSEFKPSEVNFEVKISGIVECRESAAMPDSNTGGNVYRTTVSDKLKDIAAFVCNPAKKWIASMKSEGYKCENKEGFCTLTGTILASTTAKYEEEMGGFETLSITSQGY